MPLVLTGHLSLEFTHALFFHKWDRHSPRSESLLLWQPGTTISGLLLFLPRQKNVPSHFFSSGFKPNTLPIKDLSSLHPSSHSFLSSSSISSCKDGSLTRRLNPHSNRYETSRIFPHSSFIHDFLRFASNWTRAYHRGPHLRTHRRVHPQPRARILHAVRTPRLRRIQSRARHRQHTCPS